MANEQNLRPIELTHEEAVRNGRLGGIRSGEVRREQAQMRKWLGAPLDKNLKKQFESNMGVKMKAGDDQIGDALDLVQIKKAMEGDTSAFLAVHKVAGSFDDAPTVNVNNNVPGMVQFTGDSDNGDTKDS